MLMLVINAVMHAYILACMHVCMYTVCLRAVRNIDFCHTRGLSSRALLSVARLAALVTATIRPSRCRRYASLKCSTADHVLF